MDEGIFFFLTFFGFLAAIILVPTLARERTKRSAHELVSQAMSRGQQLDPTLVQQLTQNLLEEGNRARKTLGSAVVLLALAGGFVAAGYVIDGLDPGGDIATVRDEKGGVDLEHVGRQPLDANNGMGCCRPRHVLPQAQLEIPIGSHRA